MKEGKERSAKEGILKVGDDCMHAFLHLACNGARMGDGEKARVEGLDSSMQLCRRESI